MRCVVHEENGSEVGVTSTSVRARARGAPRVARADGDGMRRDGVAADVREREAVETAEPTPSRTPRDATPLAAPRTDDA